MSDFVCLNPDRFINNRCQSKLGIIKEVHMLFPKQNLSTNIYKWPDPNCFALLHTFPFLPSFLLFFFLLSSLLSPFLSSLFSQHSLASIFIIPSQHKTNCLKSKSRIPLQLFLYCLHLALYNTLGYFTLFQTLRLSLVPKNNL